MTKKKRNHPDLEELLSKPLCYYCGRSFDDLKILINHQKAKHFKCDRCGRRLNTAGGLNVHMNQVHKETLTAIENALPGRGGLDLEIFGMEGVPDEFLQQHKQIILAEFHKNETERRSASGNPAPGGQPGNAAKKPKFESPADLKKRLAEHKAAKLAAEQNGGDSSGANTPTPTPTPTLTLAHGANPTQSTTQPTSQAFPGYQQSYAPPPSSSTFSAPQNYNQPPTQAFQSSTYAAPPSGFGQSPPPPQQPPYSQSSSTYQQPYQPPPQTQYQQLPYTPPNTFSPPPFQGAPPFPTPPFQAQVPQNGHLAQVGAHRAYNSTSPASLYPPQQRTQSPAQNGLPQRTASGGLPSALGLPQRPAVSAPLVNAAQFQQMHQGQMAVQHNFPPAPQQHSVHREEYNPAAPQVGMPPTLSNHGQDASSLDDLISSASKQADETAARAKTATPKPPTPQLLPSTKEEVSEGKPNKKEKDSKDKATKPTRLVYSDNEISPEEKMAAMPKYAFTPAQNTV